MGKRFVLTVVLACFLAVTSGQELPVVNTTQRLGFMVQTTDHTFSELTLQSMSAAAGYEYPMEYNSLLIAAVGINQLNIPSATSNVTDYEGKIGLFSKLEISSSYSIFYGKAGCDYFRTEGNIEETGSTTTGYRYSNKYILYELPVEAGLQFELQLIQFHAGLKTAWLYGKNEKTVYLLHSAGKTNLGSTDYTFYDQYGFGITGGIKMEITARYGIQVGFDYLPESDYQLGFTFWSTLPESTRL